MHTYSLISHFNLKFIDFRLTSKPSSAIHTMSEMFHLALRVKKNFFRTLEKLVNEHLFQVHLLHKRNNCLQMEKQKEFSVEVTIKCQIHYEKLRGKKSQQLQSSLWQSLDSRIRLSRLISLLKCMSHLFLMLRQYFSL